jgi:L-threonylcarbamoyladenylate synthase
MADQIEQAIDILKKGGIVAFPTDTVYGLGANSYDEEAVLRVYEAKARPRHLPLPLLVSDVSQLTAVARDMPEIAWRLAQRFLPGALTIVLYKSPSVSSLITGGSEKVAVRMPDHPIPISLIQGLGAPIIGTSANITDSPSPVTAQEVHYQMGDRVDLIIDGGRCRGGIASTVLDLSGESPTILREGAISREEIKRACGVEVHSRPTR